MFGIEWIESSSAGAVRAAEALLEPAWDSAADGPAWSRFPPSGLLLDLLGSLPMAELGDGQLLEVAAAAGALIGHAQAIQMRALSAFAALRLAQGSQEREFAAEEVGLALGVGPRAGENRLQLATNLSERLPGTLAALHAGELDLAKARVLDEATVNLSPTHARAVETAVLPEAGGMSVRRLQAATAKKVLLIDPDGEHTRHQRARNTRRVELRPGTDGMAGLYALLPAEQALAIYQRIDQLARAEAGGDGRCADARRADVFTGLLLGHSNPGGTPTVAAQVHLTLPLTTLAGMNQQPGDLAGYGPITAAHARDLATAGGATWRRLLTDPATGTVLDYGRTTYRPPAALADYIRARDQRCRYPNCGQPAFRCDLDHTLSYADGGATCASNLEALCRRHHRLKHDCPGWTLTQNTNGECTWITPTGKQHTTIPEPAGLPHTAPPDTARPARRPPGTAPPEGRPADGRPAGTAPPEGGPPGSGLDPPPF